MPTNVDFPTSNSAPATNSTTPELGKVLENLNQFFGSIPSKNEDKEKALVLQQELEFANKCFYCGEGKSCFTAIKMSL